MRSVFTADVLINIIKNIKNKYRNTFFWESEFMRHGYYNNSSNFVSYEILRPALSNFTHFSLRCTRS